MMDDTIVKSSPNVLICILVPFLVPFKEFVNDS